MQEEEDMIFVFIPSLVALLLAEEEKKGLPLIEDEVIHIRNNALGMNIPRNALAPLEEGRGYKDIDPENCWIEWCEFRNV
jgi:hypothetical protein